MTAPHRGKAADGHRDDWQTPPAFLAGLRERWCFELDAACSMSNAVAKMGLDGESDRFDALSAEWRPRLGRWTGRGRDVAHDGSHNTPAVWCNPPFGRRGVLAREFIARAAQQARDVCGPGGLDVVVLAPATPEVRWMHDHVLGGDRPADEVWVVRGRLAFAHPATGQPVSGNPVGSVVLVWRAGWRRPGAPFFGSMGRDGRPVGGAW